MARSISIAIPVPPPRVDNLLCTLRSIEDQTFPRDDIQVCIGVDAPSIAPIESSVRGMGFSFEILYDCLSRGYAHAQRNAARNKACAIATSPIIMINDCDMLLSENAVADMVSAHKYWNNNGVAIVTATCLNNIECGVTDWQKVNPEYITGRKSLANILAKVPHSFKIHDSYAKFHTSNQSKLFKEVGHIQENFPSFPKWLWEALGGFDESFVGWGGNKEEFVARIVALRRADIVRLMLLPRVILYHQPHYRSEDSNNTRLCLYNKEKYLAIRKIDQTTAWPEILAKIKVRAQAEGAYMANTSISVVCRDINEHTVKIITDKMQSNKIRYEIIADNRYANTRIMGNMAEGQSWYGLACAATQYNRILLMDNIEKWPTEISDIDLRKSNAKAVDSMILLTRQAMLNNYVHIFEMFGNIVHCLYTIRVLLSGRIDTKAQKNIVDRVIAPRGGSSILPKRSKPVISIGMLTFNRRRFLQTTLDSLMSSLRPDRFKYDIVVSDDHSNDDTKIYLKRIADTYPIKLMFNAERGGVSIQSNRLLSYFDGKVDFGFLSNDDLLFRAGWEEMYWRAHQLSGWSHFAFMDIGWEKKISTSIFPLHDLVYENGVFLVNWRPKRLQGALLTFDQRVIDKVGGFDADRFGLFSHEHVDWTVRNQRAGLAPGDGNWEHGCYDVLGSHKYVSLNLKKYHHAISSQDIDHGNETKFNQVAHDAKRIKLPIQLIRRKHAIETS